MPQRRLDVGAAARYIEAATSWVSAMIRFLFRMIGFILLAAACAAAIVDGTRSIAAQTIALFSVSDTLGWLVPAKVAAFEASAAKIGILPLRALAQAMLALPTSILLALSGGLLLYLGRAPRPSIGYSSRA